MHKSLRILGGVIAQDGRRGRPHGLRAEVSRGVEGFVLQFSDFGTPETTERFMTAVVPAVEEERLDGHADRSRRTVTITGHGDDEIEPYFATPTSPGPHPVVVMFHQCRATTDRDEELVRTFARRTASRRCAVLFTVAPRRGRHLTYPARQESQLRHVLRRAVHRRRVPGRPSSCSLKHRTITASA